MLVSVNERAAGAFYARLFGLSLNEWRTLALLGEHGDLSVKDLARLTDMDKSGASRVAAALCARGYITREANAEDGRSILLRLSSAGRKAYVRIHPVSAARQERLLQCLSPTELKRFDETLTKLTRQARRMLEEERGPQSKKA